NALATPRQRPASDAWQRWQRLYVKALPRPLTGYWGGGEREREEPPEPPLGAGRFRDISRKFFGIFCRARMWRLSDVHFMQQIIRKANHGALRNPLFRCVIVSVPAFCHWSERTPLGPSLWCKPSGGLHHAEDSNCAGCILGDAERCRRCRPASQGAA